MRLCYYRLVCMHNRMWWNRRDGLRNNRLLASIQSDYLDYDEKKKKNRNRMDNN